MTTLFTDKDGNAYDAEDVKKVLYQIGAHDCETLFIHSDIMFGTVPHDFNRKEYLSILSDVICSLGIRNIIVPTFTYSFCNHEDYDVCKSRTSMGALNEFIRKLPGRYRTEDPLLSLSVPENLKNQFSVTGNHSLGEGSGLDILHHMDGVKFLFFGAKQGECFTYLHYVEKILDVPYRFDMPFDGYVIGYEGERYKKTQYIHTHCKGVKIPPNYNYFENELMEKGKVQKRRLADSYVSCLGEKDAYEQIAEKIRKDPYYFVESPYTEQDLVHEYGFGHNGEKITHC